MNVDANRLRLRVQLVHHAIKSEPPPHFILYVFYDLFERLELDLALDRAFVPQCFPNGGGRPLSPEYLADRTPRDLKGSPSASLVAFTGCTSATSPTAASHPMPSSSTGPGLLGSRTMVCRQSSATGRHQNSGAAANHGRPSTRAALWSLGRLIRHIAHRGAPETLPCAISGCDSAVARMTHADPAQRSTIVQLRAGPLEGGEYMFQENEVNDCLGPTLTLSDTALRPLYKTHGYFR